LCGGINNAKGHKGKERCYARRRIIHINAIESTTSHIGVDNGKKHNEGQW